MKKESPITKSTKTVDKIEKIVYYFLNNKKVWIYPLMKTVGCSPEVLVALKNLKFVRRTKKHKAKYKWIASKAVSVDLAVNLLYEDILDQRRRHRMLRAEKTKSSAQLQNEEEFFEWIEKSPWYDTNRE